MYHCKVQHLGFEGARNKRAFLKFRPSVRLKKGPSHYVFWLKDPVPFIYKTFLLRFIKNYDKLLFLLQVLMKVLKGSLTALSVAGLMFTWRYVKDHDITVHLPVVTVSMPKFLTNWS